MRSPLDFLLAPYRLPLLGLAMLAGLSATSLAHADDIDEIQRRDLALIQTQIEQIKVVVNRIEQRQYEADPSQTRFYFNVPRLEADLSTISRGIDNYLSPDRLQPRDPAPLEGDYLDAHGGNTAPSSGQKKGEHQ